MAENQDRVIEMKDGSQSWLGPVVIVLAIVALAGLGFAWYDSSQLRAAQDNFGNQIKTVRQDTSQQVASLEQKLDQEGTARAELQSDLGVVTKRLRLTQGELQKAREEAKQLDEENQQKLAQMDTDVKNQLATKASTEDLNAVNGSVNGVKTDLEGTKNDLKMARSELGTLIARNHDEVEELRRMGERDYIEFTITGRNKPQKVGPFTVDLRSTNVKRHQFSVSLTVDDVRTEKRDRTVNEPVIFYQRGSHQANEFVVNEVTKDKITGYISLPKGKSPATSATGN